MAASELVNVGLPFATLTAAMLYKLLGPTAEYLGGKGQELVQRKIENLERIFDKAYRRVGDRIEMSGEVPPRILQAIINDGAYCEDEIMAEYLAGILASSRSPGKRDDRGVVMNATISRMSVYQLRTHYIVYHAVKYLYDGMGYRLDGPFNGIRIPLMTYMFAMDFLIEFRQHNEFPQMGAVLEHTFFGLEKEKLIGDFEIKHEDDSEIIVHPSILGTELFLWAYGHGDARPSDFLSRELTFDIHDDVKLCNAKTPIRGDNGEPTGKFVMPFDYAYNRSGMSCRLPSRAS